MVAEQRKRRLHRWPWKADFTLCAGEYGVLLANYSTSDKPPPMFAPGVGGER